MDGAAQGIANPAGSVGAQLIHAGRRDDVCQALGRTLPLIAWVDESVIVGDVHRPGAYTLAAVIADAAAAEGLREDLRALTERKIVRLHWVAESTKRRDLIAETVAGLGVVAIVVVGSPVQRQKQERARRCCLEHLL